MTSNEDSLYEDNQMFIYQNQALLMMQIFKPIEQGMFYEWLNRFEYVADILEVPDDKMAEFLVIMVDNDVNNLLKRLGLYDQFSEFPYEEIVQVYHNFFELPSDEIDLYRKRFSCRNQYKGEMVENYAATLEKMYDKCCFDNCRDEILRKKFINGINDSEVRSYLRNISLIKFDNVVEMAIKLSDDTI
ncbi:hypothetical protein M0804_013249 [Polistes exclamans]|nr:hypothetical protein M0804_013249 [Polistes exclamans]